MEVFGRNVGRPAADRALRRAAGEWLGRLWRSAAAAWPRAARAVYPAPALVLKRRAPGPDPTQEPPTPEERQAIREADVARRLADLKRTARWLELAAEVQGRAEPPPPENPPHA